MTSADLLFEIQCEELPPKALNAMRLSLSDNIQAQCQQHNLAFAECLSFATPRRLAVLVKDLQTQQQDKTIERKGPPLQQAFDANGNPSKACQGFAASCGVTVADLEKRATDKGTWLYCQQHIAGQQTESLLADMLTQAIKQLPIPKWMRWGNHDVSFARPVHHIVLLFNDKVIDATILGLKTGNSTCGHRFLSKGNITIKKASDYEKQLEKAFVLADFDKRKQLIKTQVENLAQQHQLQMHIDESLLDEVNGLVEWPTAQLARFNADFLQVPTEALVSAMQDHQKSFPLFCADGKLSEHFIFISNIMPKDINITIKGNEKVMTARLADAKFFFDTDRKRTLASRLDDLQQVTFQQKLGSLYAKAARLQKLCAYLRDNDVDAMRAGLLAKADLITDMVFEFTDLQGIMGGYYATHDGETEAVALAIKEQYLPAHAQDNIPSSDNGCALSIADRIDNLVGHFSLQHIPSGNKDPFALRRAAIGLIRIVVEKKLTLNLQALIAVAINNYQLQENKISKTLLSFFHDRLRVWFKDQGYSLDVIDAVLALQLTDINDMAQRIRAVVVFKNLPEAESLAAANKRVSNILQKSGEAHTDVLNEKLFVLEAEKALYQALQQTQAQQNGSYQQRLQQLALLKPLIDEFFDKVMVNCEDAPLRFNRLALLKQLRALFLQIADIAYLQS